MKDAAPRYDTGYTLIELLVAMLLLSFIGLAIAGGMQFGSRVWERSETDIGTADTVDTAQRILRDILSSALPHRAGGFVRFDGQQDRISFYGPAPQALRTGGVAHFELSVTHDTFGDGLVLRIAADAAHAARREAVLVDRLNGLRIDYMDASEKIPVWLAVWRDRDRLPDAVRIAGDGGLSAAWPPLIVRMTIAQDATCQFDVVSMACRKT